MTTLLISDLHLHPAAPEISEGFFAWLERNTRTPVTLYILGDLFDAWIGDDLVALGTQDTSGYAALADQVATRLRAAEQRGCRIRLMHGNRDFLLGQQFASAAGAELLPEACVIDLAGKPTLLMHGDSLCTRDQAYMAFRAQARNPQWQAGVLAMPIPERLALAQRMREQSGEANSTKADEIMDVTAEEVVRVMQTHRVNTLIHGHTHRPAVHSVESLGQSATRFVLGDWSRKHGWEIRADDTGVNLSRFAFSELDD